MTETTGFHEVPWDLYTANGGKLAGLPAQGLDSGNGDCPSRWRGPTDRPYEQPWMCTLSAGHTTTHRGSNGTETLAEWRDEDEAARR